MVSIALADLEATRSVIKDISESSLMWGTVYKLHYDALHQLVEAFIRLDRIKSNNHQCLFAYLCEKHPELELDWKFFEKIRTKRNGRQYYGTPISYKDWKEIELQIVLYISTIKNIIEDKLK